MKTIIVSAMTCLLAATALPAFAQTNSPQTKSPNVSTPSTQNSGAGIAGAPGNKNGPAEDKGTVGNSANRMQNPTVQQQDSSKVQGLPGNKSGPAAKPPSH